MCFYLVPDYIPGMFIVMHKQRWFSLAKHFILKTLWCHVKTLGLISSWAPNLFRYSLDQLQFAAVSQYKTAHLTLLLEVCICAPHGLVIIVVHDQVAVSLHDHTVTVWSIGAWSPHRLAVTIDDEVTITLQAETEAFDWYPNNIISKVSISF